MSRKFQFTEGFSTKEQPSLYIYSTLFPYCSSCKRPLMKTRTSSEVSSLRSLSPYSLQNLNISSSYALTVFFFRICLVVLQPIIYRLCDFHDVASFCKRVDNKTQNCVWTDYMILKKCRQIFYRIVSLQRITIIIDPNMY